MRAIEEYQQELFYLFTVPKGHDGKVFLEDAQGNRIKTPMGSALWYINKKRDDGEQWFYESV